MLQSLVELRVLNFRIDYIIICIASIFFSILIWFVKNEKEDIVLDWKNDILRKLVI